MGQSGVGVGRISKPAVSFPCRPDDGGSRFSEVSVGSSWPTPRLVVESDEEWNALAVRAQSDPRALNRLLDDVRPIVDAALRKRGIYYDVEDVVQEVLINIHKGLHDYAPPVPFKGWAIIVARNTASNIRRNRRNYAKKKFLYANLEAWVKEEFTMQVQYRPDLDLEAKETRRRVEQAVEKLTPPRREALERHIAGMDQGEVRDRFGVTPSAHASNLQLARDRVYEAVHGESRPKEGGGPGVPQVDWPSREEVIALIEESSYSAAGRKLGVTDNSLRKFLQRTGGDPKIKGKYRGRGRVDWPEDEVLKEMVDERGFYEVAEELGCSHQAVRSRMKRAS